MKINKINLTIWVPIFVLGLILDQLSKYWARYNLPLDNSIIAIPNLLHWKLLFNTGAAFSSLAGQTHILAIISLVFSIIILCYTFKKINYLNKLKIAALAFLLAGSVGNLIDRALFGKVTDFIDLLLLPGNFPIFNMADIWINLAVFIFILDWIFGHIRH